jgi:hypothetical protein
MKAKAMKVSKTLPATGGGREKNKGFKHLVGKEDSDAIAIELNVPEYKDPKGLKCSPTVGMLKQGWHPHVSVELKCGAFMETYNESGWISWRSQLLSSGVSE